MELQSIVWAARPSVPGSSKQNFSAHYGFYTIEDAFRLRRDGIQMACMLSDLGFESTRTPGLEAADARRTPSTTHAMYDVNHHSASLFATLETEHTQPPSLRMEADRHARAVLDSHLRLSVDIPRPIQAGGSPSPRPPSRMPLFSAGKRNAWPCSRRERKRLR
jgi:hypothetical protein